MFLPYLLVGFHSMSQSIFSVSAVSHAVFMQKPMSLLMQQKLQITLSHLFCSLQFEQSDIMKNPFLFPKKKILKRTMACFFFFSKKR